MEENKIDIGIMEDNGEKINTWVRNLRAEEAGQIKLVQFVKKYVTSGFYDAYNQVPTKELYLRYVEYCKDTVLIEEDLFRKYILEVHRDAIETMSVDGVLKIKNIGFDADKFQKDMHIELKEDGRALTAMGLGFKKDENARADNTNTVRYRTDYCAACLSRTEIYFTLTMGHSTYPICKTCGRDLFREMDNLYSFTD